MSSRAFMEEEDFDDFAEVPLKLHSVLEFLDTALASVDGNTERQHVSSADSESEEDGRGCDTPVSLHLTPFLDATAATAHVPRQCFCLDKARCMCSLFALPPLLPPRSATPAATPRLVSSSGVPTVMAAPAATQRSAAAGVHFVPLRLEEVHLTQPKNSNTTAAAAAPTTTLTRTSTRTTCCRC